MSQPEERESGRGFWGRILNVDLSAGKVEYEQPPEAVYHDFLGGLGLGAKVLWDRLEPGVDPLGPKNILGITPGLLTDTGALFTGRFNVVGKSPLTGGWGDANCGGYFAPALKRCGLDGVFITGAAERPVYLLIEDDSAQILDASELWGLDTSETEARLKELHGRRAQAAIIGPAGERLSLIAGITNDHGRIAARSGLGAVMGSKKLKAVVCVGRKKIATADPEKIKALSKQFRLAIERGGRPMKRILGDRFAGFLGWITRKGSVYLRQPADVFRVILDKFGTSGITVMSAESGDSPIKNWAGVGYADFPMSRSRKIGAEAIEAYKVKRYGCFSCPLRCGAILEVNDGRYPVGRIHRPEYETLCAFGGLLLNDDLASIFKINDLVNRAGIDSISTGATVAFAIECFENGILTAADTGGLELGWGKSEAIVKLTEMIIEREGLGDILADGVKRAAERIGRGSEAYAVHCGGQEAPMHDPKFDPGTAMAYHCEPAPGRHTVATYQLIELERIDRLFSGVDKLPAFTTHKAKYTVKGKGRPMAVGSCYHQLIDCAGACEFGAQIGGPMPLFDWLNAAAGWRRSADDYLLVGERVEQLRHAFNLREGINAIRDFKPHPRTYGDPPQDKGPAKGLTLDQDGLAREFYEAMGWDVADGRPDPARLRRLGLDEVADWLETGE